MKRKENKRTITNISPRKWEERWKERWSWCSSGTLWQNQMESLEDWETLCQSDNQIYLVDAATFIAYITFTRFYIDPVSFLKQREKGEQRRDFIFRESENGITWSLFFFLLQLSGFKDFVFFALKWHRYFSLSKKKKKSHDVHIIYLEKKRRKWQSKAKFSFICLILASILPLSIFQTAGDRK